MTISYDEERADTMTDFPSRPKQDLAWKSEGASVTHLTELSAYAASVGRWFEDVLCDRVVGRGRGTDGAGEALAWLIDQHPRTMKLIGDLVDEILRDEILREDARVARETP